MEKDALVLGHYISELEQLVNRLSPNCHTALRRALLAKVDFFGRRKPTATHHGVGFANRVMAAHFRVRNLFDETQLEPLAAFAEKQSNLMIEIANMRIDERNLIREERIAQEPEQAEGNATSEAAEHQDVDPCKETEEEGEILQEIPRPITPISPVPSSPIPFSVPILSLNTSTRHHVTKDNTQPFTLTFNHGTRHYDLIDSYHHPSYFLHTFHPLDLKIAVWAPGSLQVHTQTKDYVKKNGTGDYMNFSVENVEGLERLVEELKRSGVEILKMEL
ncbi:MAG: hypothetical protein Q9169_000976 [Polycauliona sp. 2 TL-2023]